LESEEFIHHQCTLECNYESVFIPHQKNVLRKSLQSRAGPFDFDH